MGYIWFVILDVGDDLNGLVDDKPAEKAQVISDREREREREREKERERARGID